MASSETGRGNVSGRGVAGMPAFCDPYDVNALGGSVNFGHPNWPTIEEGHPLKHSDDYGGNIREDWPSGGEQDANAISATREEWTRDEWAEQARLYDLPVGGTKQEIIDRVLAHEAEQQKEV